MLGTAVLVHFMSLVTRNDPCSERCVVSRRVTSGDASRRGSWRCVVSRRVTSGDASRGGSWRWRLGGHRISSQRDVLKYF